MKNVSGQIKSFFNLPVVVVREFLPNLSNYLITITSTLLWYYIFVILGGYILQNDIEYYVSEEHKNYISKALLLLCSFLVSFPTKGLLNYLGYNFFINKRLDLVFYPPILFVLYFIINEILNF